MLITIIRSLLLIFFGVAVFIYGLGGVWEGALTWSSSYTYLGRDSEAVFIYLMLGSSLIAYACWDLFCLYYSHKNNS